MHLTGICHTAVLFWRDWFRQLEPHAVDWDSVRYGFPARYGATRPPPPDERVWVSGGEGQRRAEATYGGTSSKEGTEWQVQFEDESAAEASEDSGVENRAPVRGLNIVMSCILPNCAVFLASLFFGARCGLVTERAGGEYLSGGT